MDILKRFDNLQYRAPMIRFIVAVIKRYSEDQGGKYAALTTYYIFTSLFPLLLWIGLLSRYLNNIAPSLSSKIIHGATAYFPIVGQQLYNLSHGAHRSLSGMIVLGLLALYGARGSAGLFRTAVNEIWGVPETEQVGFPWSWIRSFGIAIVGGGGFIITAVITSWALGQGHGNIFRVLITFGSIVLLAGVFMGVLKLALPSTVRLNRALAGAISMSVAMTLLQLLGGYYVTHELKNYTSYTSLFAIPLVLLAWIYLEAQILLYSLEVTIVREKKLWPVRLIA